MTRYASVTLKSLCSMALTSGLLLVTSSGIAQESGVRMGTIEQAKHITLQSSGAGGAVAGAALGYNIGSGNSDSKKRRRAVIGGAIGSAAASSSRPGMEYTVKFVDGSTTTLVSDQTHLTVGQCVSVELMDKSANLREQDPAACNPDPQAQEAVADLQDELAEDAAECAQAKQEIADAKTMDEVEVATAKARILCN